MVAKIVKVEPFGLVLFGAAADLACRALRPARLNRKASDLFSEPPRRFAAGARSKEFE
jgi:glucose-6-phosphate 1-dehydrogenase